MKDIRKEGLRIESGASIPKCDPITKFTEKENGVWAIMRLNMECGWLVYFFLVHFCSQRLSTLKLNLHDEFRKQILSDHVHKSQHR